MTKLSEAIVDLKSQGLTYDEISAKLTCSKGTISYHLRPDLRNKSVERRRKSRLISHPLERKVENFRLNVRPVPKRQSTCTVAKSRNNKVSNFTRRGRKGLPAERFTFTDVVAKVGERPTCYLTGDPIDLMAPETYQLDHIVPRSRGGSNGIENVGLATTEANMAKHDMPLEEFLDLCEKVLRTHGRL